MECDEPMIEKMQIEKIQACFAWGTLGVFAGMLFTYYLYRIGIPLIPFVYQAF
jgi:hypothetical protein